jgi:hypothetical protein
MRRLVPLWTDCHDMVAPLLTGIPGSEEFITQTCQGGTGAGGGGGGSDCTDQDALVASVAGMGCAALVPITGCDYDTGLGPLSTYCAMSCGACGGAAPPPAPPPAPPSDGCVSAKSCEELQAQYGEWPAGTYTPNLCGESDAGFFGNGDDDTAACFGNDDNDNLGWEHAQAVCFEVGARLCTIDELRGGVAAGTGCGHNTAPVWSANPCGAGHMQSTFTATEGGVWPSVQSCMADDSNLAIRCCADSSAIRAGVGTCDAFAAQQDGCASRRSCADLAAASGRNSWPTGSGDHGICGEADGGLGPAGTTECNDHKTWAEAQSICLGAGARLCTVEELEANEARSTGCSNNRKLVWSVDTGPCEAGAHALVVGYSHNAVDDMVTHCEADETPAAVSCCADSQSRIDAADVTCGEGAGGPPPPMAPCISAMSCEALQAAHGEWPASQYQPSVCGESDAGLSDGCAGGEQSETEGWEAAEATCFEVGARLCTASELYTGAAYGTGCDHNGGLVWSSTECGDRGGRHGRHMANTLVVAGATLADISSVNSCETDDTNAAIRCCADARNARMGLSTCDLYSSEEAVCTSSMTCAQLGARFHGSWARPQDIGRGSSEVCGESDEGLGPGGTTVCMGGSHGTISWQDAEAACLAAGARLCTVEEIEADETRGSGCSHDAAMVWTVDDVACAAGEKPDKTINCVSR